MHRSALVLAAASFVFSVAALAQSGNRADDTIPRDIQAYSERVSAALNAHDPAAIAAIYTADGEFVTPDGSVHTGRSDIQGSYAAVFKVWGPDFKVDIQPLEAHKLGSDYWEIGKVTVTLQRPSGPVEIHEHFTSILAPRQKQLAIRLLSIAQDTRPAAATPGTPTPH